ncbi:serine/threonine-protein phosphatase [candidate division KSB1 bacterium]|nr:serine/threonine-protein phosphatase [candidate division KSB1 bacterium]
MKIEFKAATNIGMVRKANEDSYCILEDTNSAFLCDGMGGHVAGATASQLAIETISHVNLLLNRQIFLKKYVKVAEELSKYFYQLNTHFASSLPETAVNMVNAIQLANTKIFNTAADNPDLQGMGTTVVGFSFVENLCCIAHVGDSRAYRIRGDQIEQQTVDHSWLNELLHAGKLQADEADKFPHRNVITRALGVSPTLQIDLRVDPVQKGDIYIICSDGLHDLIGEKEILATIQSTDAELESGIDELIKMANQRGGKDNITLVMAKILEPEEMVTNYHYKATIPEENFTMTEIENKVLEILFDRNLQDTVTSPIGITHED